jgi:hypothetical protein
MTLVIPKPYLHILFTFLLFTPSIAFSYQFTYAFCIYLLSGFAIRIQAHEGIFTRMIGSQYFLNTSYYF